MSPEVEYVEVQLELGHQAIPNPKNAPEGFTHQWTLFVRGPDDCKIEEFVDKVVFNLHESFPKHRRSFREPPFSVREYGYAGFELPIDIYFKNKEEPKKITYNYDLFLHTDDSVHNTRREKLTFQNPSPDFKKKLLRAGGKCYPDPKEKTTGHVVAAKQKPKSVAASPPTPASNPSASPTPRDTKLPAQRGSTGNPKHRVPQKDIPSHPVVASATPAVAAAKQIRDKPAAPKHAVKADPFTDLFGPPLQSRPSPDPVKQKEKSRKVKTENEGVTKVKREQKESAQSSKTHQANTSVPQVKSSSSRLPSPSPSQAKGDVKGEKCSKRSKSKKKSKKESRSSSSSSQDSGTAVHNDSSRKCDSKVKSKAESGEDRRTKVKGKDIRSVATGATGASNSSQKSKDVKKENFTSTTISFSNNNNTGTTTLEIKSVKKEKTWDSESKKSKSREFNNEDCGPSSDTKPATKQSQDQDPQRAVSSSPTSITSDANGAPGNGGRDDASSPRSSAGSRRKKCESGSDSEPDAMRDKKWKQCDGSSDDDNDNKSARREKYLTDLLWVQKRINETTDPILLQRVVDMIETSCTEYEVTKNSFDFDLLRLDDATLFKLRQIVEKG